MTTIGIIGQGFVGSAVREGFRGKVEIYAYDKKDDGDVWCYGVDGSKEIEPQGSPFDIFLAFVDGPIFFCLPTPMKSDGSCDTSIVEEMLFYLEEEFVGATVVIKSTVPPGSTERWNQKYKNLQIVFNPEFLTEVNAINDFKNQDRIILGGPPTAMVEVEKLYNQAFPGVLIVKMRSTEAEMVKYMTNVALAVKVSLANELKQICDRVGADYDAVWQVACLDKRLGNTHWNVPGPDGHLGFGGSCFPKDLNALIHIAEELGVYVPTMKAAWEKNVEVRPERDWEQLKGRAVVEETVNG